MRRDGNCEDTNAEAGESNGKQRLAKLNKG
jgi:hypothetical protein